MRGVGRGCGGWSGLIAWGNKRGWGREWINCVGNKRRWGTEWIDCVGVIKGGGGGSGLIVGGVIKGGGGGSGLIVWG